MEKVKAYIYNLSEDKVHIRLTIGSVLPTVPNLPLASQKTVRVTGGYRIDEWKKIQKKLTWYRTDRTLILPNRDDAEAFEYFRGILNLRSRRAMDALYASERILDDYCLNFQKGSLIEVIGK